MYESATNPVLVIILTNDTDLDTLVTTSRSADIGVAGNVGVDVAGIYGTLHLNDDGSYTYTLDNTKASVQALAQGQNVSDTFSYTKTDNHGATSSANLTINISGTKDGPTAVADNA